MAFRFDKLTIKAQEAVANAQSLALDQGNPEIDVLHLTAALLDEKEGIVQPVLAKAGVDLLQRDDVGSDLADDIDDAAGVAPAVGADAFVDVVGGDDQPLGPRLGQAR